MLEGCHVAFPDSDQFPVISNFEKDHDYKFGFTGANGLLMIDKKEPGILTKVVVFDRGAFIKVDGAMEYKGSYFAKRVGSELVVPIEVIGIAVGEDNCVLIQSMEKWPCSLRDLLKKRKKGLRGNGLNIVGGKILRFLNSKQERGALSF
jgi:hypothetical protein